MSNNHGSMSKIEMVNRYSKVSAHLGGWVTLGPKAARVSNFMVPISLGFVGLGFMQVCYHMIPKGYYLTSALCILLFASAVYNTLACMFKDPGIIVRPPDYIEKKAKWELEEKERREHEEKKRLEEVKDKFEQNKMHRVDYDDTPIPMNETISSDKDTDIDQPTITDKKKVKKDKSAKPNSKVHSHDSKGGCCDELHIHKSRTCNTCQIERPPLASHCSSCNHCVKGFDHHCMVTNCCIAERNFRNFILLQFFVGCCAVLALIVIPIFYLELLDDLEEDNKKYFDEYWVKMLLWHSLGLLCMSLTLVGAIPCCLFGTVGFAMSTWIMMGVFEHNLLILYPFICTFGLPIFLGTLFMALSYAMLIMDGSNKKIEAAKEKFEFEHGKKYVKEKEGFGIRFSRLCTFIFCDTVSPSELTQ